MSTYQELKGLKVKYLSSDTSGDRVKEGEVFYNSTDFKLKSFVSTAAWHSSASMITARRLFASSSGNTQSAAWGAGGYVDGTGDQNSTEEYNGSGFSSSGNINTARREFDGAGTQTAGLIMGGRIGSSQQQAQTEEYDGSSWTSSNDLNTGRQRGSGAGIQTAGLYFGGIGDEDATEEYNGTSWTAGGNLNTGRPEIGGSGLQTAALGCGGTPYRNITEEYDGSSWTAGGNLNTARHALRSAGIQTASITFGGLVPPSGADTTATETYDGSSWTTSPATLGTARAELGRAGTTSAALAFGGFLAPGITANSEEFTVSVLATTAAAWSSGGDYPASVGIPSASSTGTQTAQLAAGGYVGGAPGRTNVTGEYNGTSWSTGGTVPALVDSIGLGGTQTAAISAGEFRNDPTNTYDTSRDYDGSSWTTNNSLPAPAFDVSVFGTQTACIGSGGVDTAPYPGRFGLDRTLSWDGTNWTSLSAPSNQNTARFLNARAGVQTAAMISGGNDVSNYPGGAPKISTVENWDGSSWTAGTSMNTARSNTAGGGIQTLAYVAGGNTGSNTTQTELWDGSSWATSANLSTGGEGTGGTGTTPSAGIMFGRRPTAGAATEEFTGETTAVRAVKTIDFD
jgi:hypothetical protein